MGKKSLNLGTLVLLLLLGLFCMGCSSLDDGGYTFEFKVDNYIWSGLTVTRVEIFDGSNINAPVLQTVNFSLSAGEMSGIFRVSGFSERGGDNLRIFGVRVTCGEEKTYFGYKAVPNKAKIRVWVSGINMGFYVEDW